MCIRDRLKRVLKGKPVGHIAPAVDIYNTVSLTYALPVGGEDLHLSLIHISSVR